MNVPDKIHAIEREQIRVKERFDARPLRRRIDPRREQRRFHSLLIERLRIKKREQLLLIAHRQITRRQRAERTPARLHRQAPPFHLRGSIPLTQNRKRTIFSSKIMRKLEQRSEWVGHGVIGADENSAGKSSGCRFPRAASLRRDEQTQEALGQDG